MVNAVNTAGSEVRFQFTQVVAAGASRIRDLLLAHPVLDPSVSRHRLGSLPEQATRYPLGRVLDGLNGEQASLLRAVADYPYALAYHPDTGRINPLGHALARLMTALADPIIRFHGQTEPRGTDAAIKLDHDLRAVLAAASMLLTEVGPIDVDVHRHAQTLPADTDPRWRACLAVAAAYAEPVWSRAAANEHLVHQLGLQMLAIALYVVSLERLRDPADVQPWQLDLLSAVAHDEQAHDAMVESDGRGERANAQATAGRSNPVTVQQHRAELCSRVEVTLVHAGINLHNPDDGHRNLVEAWRHLQHPPPDYGDIADDGQPYTHRSHLAEGVVRASMYLGQYQPI